MGGGLLTGVGLVGGSAYMSVWLDLAVSLCL